MFYDAPRRNIEKYLPAILTSLEKVGLGDRDMILMALSTIRAESASFAPISEFQSKYNTTPREILDKVGQSSLAIGLAMRVFSSLGDKLPRFSRHKS